MKRAMNSQLKKRLRFKSQKQRVIAVFCLLTFLNTLVPYNVIYATGGGPTAPEAASFEPVDATDMVNLNTGGFTYVLPLMNVPSPEGGYPIAMSHHAGIAVDQTPSWVGLGWTLNPGAINRSVQGYPDDYQGAQITDFFYDNGDTVTSYSLSLSYSAGVTVGVGMSWGSHQASSGYVSVGFGLNEQLSASATLGINQASSIGISAKVGALSFGVSASTDGSVGVSAGISGGDNGVGFSVGASTNGTYSAGITANSKEERFASTTTTSASLGVSFTKDGVSGMSVEATSHEYSVDYSKPIASNENYNLANQTVHSGTSGAGISLNFAQSKAMDMGDYITSNSSNFFGLIIPTPIGVFSLGGGKNKYEYYLAINKANYMSGPLHFNEALRKKTMYKVEKRKAKCINNPRNTSLEVQTKWLFGEVERDNYISNNTVDCPTSVNNQTYYYFCSVVDEIEYSPVQDILEFPIEDYGLGKVSHLLANNISFPAYDNFNVQAQGLSGAMSLRMHENGALFGLKDHKGELEYSAEYEDFMDSSSLTRTFEDKPHFEFDNEITNFLQVFPADFKSATLKASQIEDYFDGGSNLYARPRRYTSNYVEHYTYRDIQSKYSDGTLLSEGFLFSDAILDVNNPSVTIDNPLFTPPGSGTDLNAVDAKIAAFKITAMDGKTYHYSLPVYNHEVITRTYGYAKEDDGEPKDEHEVYTEKRQLSPFATHWLLTAITGPDFIDVNANGTADDGDYGYWTCFEYGKWSDGFIWKTPYDKEYMESPSDPDVKTYIRGRKEVYYLDKVKTRTHTAIFVKEEDVNHGSIRWVYRAADHNNAAYSSDRLNNSYDYRFTVDAEQALRLKSILLFKNEDAVNINSTNAGSHHEISNYHFPQSALENDRTLKQSNFANVITQEDFSPLLESRCLKKIEFVDNENASLIKEVHFLGKGGAYVMPPYKFLHYGIPSTTSSKTDWGYHNFVQAGSLREIFTPMGGRLSIAYEKNDFYKPMIDKGREFNQDLAIEVLTDYEYAEESVKNNPKDAFKKEYLIKVYGKDVNYTTIGTSIYRTIQNKHYLKDYFEVSESGEKDTFVDIWAYLAENGNGTGNIDVFTLNVLPQFAEVTELNESGNWMILKVVGSSPYYRNDKRIEWSYENGGYIKRKYNRLCKANNPELTMTTRELIGGDWSLKNSNTGRYDVAVPGERNGPSSSKAYSLRYTITGNKSVEPNSQGGGVRVKSITSKDNEGGSYTQSYDYSYPEELRTTENSDQESSGALSYIPHEFNEQIPYASQLPAPRVMYEYVTLTQDDGTYTRYHFNVMKERTDGKLKFSDFYQVEQDDNGSTTPVFNDVSKREVKVTDFVVKDNLIGLGSLLSTKNFNSKDQLLSENINTYFSFDELESSGLGVTQESYQMYKIINYDDHGDNHEEAHDDSEGIWFVTSSTRKRYPSLLKSTTSISGGYRFTTEFLDFDLGRVEGTSVRNAHTGKSQKTRTYNAFGEELVIENKAAFHIPAYATMGHKKDDSTYKHMLSQPAYTISKQIDADGTEHIIGVNIGTWKDTWGYKKADGTSTTESGVWRKHKEYVWKGEIDNEGYYASDFTENNLGGFDWTIGATQSGTKWQEAAEHTIYSRYSKLLELKDLNGNYASTKMCDGDTKTLAVCNAKYEDMFYTGMEYGSESGVILLKNTSTNTSTQEGVTDAHTGSKYIISSSSSEGILSVVIPNINNHHRGKPYKVSVWVDAISIRSGDYPTCTNVTFNHAETVFAGDWALLSGLVTVPISGGTYTLSSGTSNQKFDDFRMYPITSAMTSYVYNEWDELSYIVENSGLATYFMYDLAGNLKETHTEVIDFNGDGSGGFKKIATNSINYKK